MQTIIMRGYRTELDPNLQQRLLLQRHAGTARFAYNWGLEKVWEAYLAGGKPSAAMDLQKELNRLKKTDFPWMYEVSKCAPEQALRDLEDAHDRFLRSREELAKRAKASRRTLRKDGMPHGFPRFKGRKRGIGSFRFSKGIRVFRKAIRAMMRNHHLAGSIADAGWGEAIRQLEYKTALCGSRLVKARSDFPSTRGCSRRHRVNPELPLSQRVFRCERCGLTIGRDLNAAKNIEFVALSCRETVSARQSQEVTAPALLEAAPGGEAGTESGIFGQTSDTGEGF
jgi:putative transposase